MEIENGKTEYISTTFVAIYHGIKQHELFSFLGEINWIEKINGRWRITDLGMKKGGKYSTTKDGISYIVWPNTIFLKENLNIEIEINKKDDIVNTNSLENINVNHKNYSQIETNKNNIESMESNLTISVDNISSIDKKTVSYEKVNIASDLYRELRQYCDDNGIRFVDFVENALETALYENQISTVESKADTKSYKSESNIKNKTDKYSPTKIHTNYKKNYPNHVLFVQCGSFFEVYNDDALACSSLFGWKTFNRGEFRVAGIPKSHKHILVDKLRQTETKYIIIEQQIDEDDLNHPIKRKITEIFPN